MTSPLALLDTAEDITDLIDGAATTKDMLVQVAISLVIGQLLLMENDQWYDHEEITRMANRVVSFVESAQRQVALLTDSYIQRVVEQVTGEAQRATEKVRVDELRQGVQHAAVYGRLADNYRYLRSVGKSEAEAQSQVLSRAETMVLTDSLLALRAQAEKSIRNHPKIVGWRRVIHPERSREGTCGLCLVASDRIYSKQELLAIHDKCECTVAPIVRVGGKTLDPGNDLNQQDLKDIYNLAGGNLAAKLKKVRVAYHVHGELGPVIGYRGQHFRTASDVKKAEAA